MKIPDFELFDAHFHIIDPRFPLVPNHVYLPERYIVRDYLERTEDYNLKGGAVVSGSFHAFDQDYLVNALSRLGSGFGDREASGFRLMQTRDLRALPCYRRQ